nr:claudin-10 isoform X4 [Zootoca vivipara]
MLLTLINIDLYILWVDIVIHSDGGQLAPEKAWIELGCDGPQARDCCKVGLSGAEKAAQGRAAHGVLYTGVTYSGFLYASFSCTELFPWFSRLCDIKGKRAFWSPKQQVSFPEDVKAPIQQAHEENGEMVLRAQGRMRCDIWSSWSRSYSNTLTITPHWLLRVLQYIGSCRVPEGKGVGFFPHLSYTYNTGSRVYES